MYLSSMQISESRSQLIIRIKGKNHFETNELMEKKEDESEQSHKIIYSSWRFWWMIILTIDIKIIE
jgi:hypothetical protein